eukprot:3502242-Amphidinium_carterae.1
MIGNRSTLSVDDQIPHAIKAQPTHKATPDAIPAEVWHMVAPQASEPLAQLLLHTLHREKAVPRSYAGARIVGVWKKEGCMMTQTLVQTQFGSNDQNFEASPRTVWV